MQGFLAELKRRKVYHVAIAYTAAAWAILQVADIVLPVLNLPDRTMRLVLTVAAAGFPVAMVLAWAFDITPEGVMPIDDIPAEQHHGRPLTLPIAQLLLTILLVAGVGFLYYDRLYGDGAETAQSNEPPPLESKSIAVLPFTNLSTDPGNRYFSDGISEELLNSLAKIDGLYAAARTSSFHFRDASESAIEIGEKLGVATLLEGSVRKSGNRVRITAQLIDTRNGYHLWSETYDATLEDIFEVQDEISRRVVGSIIPVILDQRAPPTGPTTSDVRAYDEYLLGRALLRGLIDDRALMEARERFQQAISLDPDYAEAYAGKCEALLELYRRYKKSVDFDNAYNACQTALDKSSTESTSWDVHIALGILFREAGNFARSLKALEEARRYKSELARSLQQIGMTHAAAGDRVKAEALMREAVAIDHSNWDSYLVLANFLHDYQEYEKAIVVYDKVLEVIPDSVDALIGKGSALHNLGDTDEAETAWLLARKLAEERDESALGLIYTNLGLHYYYSGDYRRAVEMHEAAAESIRENHRVWGRIAESYRALGDREREQSSYAVAIALAEEELTHNPRNWETLGLLGIYHGFSGHEEPALSYMVRMLDQDGAPSTAHYFAALTYWSRGHSETAYDQMEAAIASGFPAAILTEDPDLKRLRETDPERFDAVTRHSVY